MNKIDAAIRTLLCSGALILSSTIALAETYLCIGQESTGFQMKGNWRTTTFKVDNDKYVIRRVKNDEKDILGKSIAAPFVVQKVGDDFIDSRMNACQFNQVGNLLFCNYFGADVIFNPKKLRFQLFNKFGYVLQEDNDSAGDVSLTIGKCSEI